MPKNQSILLDGRLMAGKIRAKARQEAAKLKIIPGLAVILVGKNPASETYVRLKEKACREAGFHFEKHALPAKVSQKKAINLVCKLNKNKRINGILVQLPLPGHLDANKIIMAIDPNKDADGFHPENFNKLMAGKPTFVPPTLAGIVRLIKSTRMKLAGKKALIVANSETFAQPLAMILEKEGAIARIFISGKGRNLKEKSRRADILVTAVGQPEFISADMVKKGAVVIDVGCNKVKGKTVGDADFAKVSEKEAFITPPVGGVGPMTVAMLIYNVLKAAKKQAK